MRVLTWNVDASAQTTPKKRKIYAILEKCAADIVCLTEAFPENMPSKTHVIVSEQQSNPTNRWQKAENQGAAKVIVWSRWGWSHVDKVGSIKLPKGRFIYAQMIPPNKDPLHIIAVAIPWAAYRDAQCQGNWDGFFRYVDTLKNDILPKLPKQRTIILGDTNMRFNAKSMRGSSKAGQQVLADALQNYQIITSGMVDPNSGKNMVDHIVLSSDLSVQRVAILKQHILNDAPHAPVLADIII